MTEFELKKHKIAAKKLDLIKNRAFGFIKKNLGKISEYDVHEFIIEEFKKENLVFDGDNYKSLIVAADENTSFVHYFPSKTGSSLIRKNSLVMIDIWARLKEEGAPFADITWMGFAGKKIPAEINKAFKKVIGARDFAVRFIEKKLKKPGAVSRDGLMEAKTVDGITRNFFGKNKAFFKHGTGHSLGFKECHGKYFRFNKKSRSFLKAGIPFTIEPGLYFPRKFGVRSEINCYIGNDLELTITTKLQNKIVKI